MDYSFDAGRNWPGRKRHRTQTQVIRAVVFISLDVFVKVTNIEQERCAFAVVQVG